MKKHLIIFGFSAALVLALSGCGSVPSANTPAAEPPVSVSSPLPAAETQATPVSTEAPSAPGRQVGELSDEQALAAIRQYCLSSNPDLEGIVNAREYPVYWEIASSDANEIVVLYRSYTGALVRYYIDRTTGETYVTEFVSGITPEEQRTEEHLNVWDYPA